MDDLHWPLTALVRAIKYKNLTGASANIGLSQPQLSRLIAKIEQELNLVLLDRSSKRGAQWTPEAHKLARTYRESQIRLRQSIQDLQNDSLPSHCRIGTLEGLSSAASVLAKELLDTTTTRYLQLDVFELSDLEAQFQAGELDLILSSRCPGFYKGSLKRKIGHQSFSTVDSNKDYLIFSPVEYIERTSKRQSKVKNQKVLVSNSLDVRKKWLVSHGGIGQFPNELQPNSKGRSPVFLVGSEYLNSNIWSVAKVVKFDKP